MTNEQITTAKEINSQILSGTKIKPDFSNQHYIVGDATIELVDNKFKSMIRRDFNKKITGNVTPIGLKYCFKNGIFLQIVRSSTREDKIQRFTKVLYRVSVDNYSLAEQYYKQLWESDDASMFLEKFPNAFVD